MLTYPANKWCTLMHHLVNKSLKKRLKLTWGATVYCLILDFASSNIKEVSHQSTPPSKHWMDSQST